ncbi:Hypothetical protein CINCED_3A005512 [Cinara cedri]|uniref:Ig-like domain-containing protein n=1 Tax=Cinara cedri TaxID=506608 RepID=A0A5E4MCI6_9HEMI|nr:Hypothetical protein CINCED_3A005512 [Cinara cedri]
MCKGRAAAVDIGFRKGIALVKRSGQEEKVEEEEEEYEEYICMHRETWMRRRSGDVETEEMVVMNGYEPDFMYPLENVTIAQGRDAIFTCVVNNIGGNRVSAPEGVLQPARIYRDGRDIAFSNLPAPLWNVLVGVS